MRNTDRRVRHRSLLFWLAVLGVVALAGSVRFYDLDWDEGTHLHPDERYLTMVISAVRFPSELTGPDGAPTCSSFWSCLKHYWNTAESPLNPAGYDQFSNFVYGTLPLFTTRAAARWVDDACGEAPQVLPSLYRQVMLGTTDRCASGYYTGYSGIHLVGRSLSGMADLITLLGLVVLARTLYGQRTALLSGMLYALAPLPIQHAHFFVVDSFATVFVVWALLFCVLSTRRNRLAWLVPAGLATGLAVASKASVWPLAAIVAVAGVYRPAQEGNEEVGRRRLSARITIPLLAALALSGAVAALAFRTTQPYAFSGPGFWNVGLNNNWLLTMKEIGELMRGLRDVPFGHQWTARTPIIFPGRNMVVWGLGLPIGLAACAGWGWMGVQLIQRKRTEHLLPWLWGTTFFLYQATQWVKSMRYLLPVYPVFVLFAAWMAVKVSSPVRSSEQDDDGESSVEMPSRETHTALLAIRRAVVQPLARALPYLLVAGAAVWCLAFLSLYRNSLTRIEASRWMYDNVPTAVALQTEHGETINVPWGPRLVLTPDQNVSTVTFIAPQSARITEIALPKVSGSGINGYRILRAAVGDGIASASVTIPGLDSVALSMQFDTPIDLEEGETVALELALVDGPVVSVGSSVVANEHWDDPLPLRMEGRDAFFNWYQGLSSSSGGQINNYDDDTIQKRASLFNWLDEADVIVLSSNRLYASIPRLPQRYPLTTEYYRLLLGGTLGFDLAAEFVSYAALGVCQFPDQENPFPLATPLTTNAKPCSIDLGPAEEAFSVYDHPTVLIFRKNDDYSRANVEALLPKSLLDGVRWMTPREATQDSADDDGSSLLLTAGMRAEQERGGTWSELFNTNAIQNLSGRVAVVMWALFLTLLGWIAFPLVYLLFPNLRCRAYGLSRVIGLLIWAYLGWLLASLHILPFARIVLWLLVLAMAGASALLARRHWAGLRTLVSEQWRNMLAVDVVFLLLFLVWVGVRWMNPDLWHPVVGGEKPMDFAYFNAVIKSTWFPPYDPWFAGGKLNYYYFGFVLVGSLTKALGIMPSVAYNLAIPSLFALTGVGGYTLASNLAGGDERRGLRAGIWGVVMVVILGNLGEVRLLANGFALVGDVQFESLIPGYPELISMLVGIWKVVAKGVTLPFRPEWWYWDATRIIPIEPGEVGPINEFPAFTFLYADLHAHAMALPLTQIGLAVALQWALGTANRCLAGVGESAQGVLHSLRRVARWALPQPAGSLLLAGLVAGALRATNTWDYPTYLALMTVGFWIGLMTAHFQAKGETAQPMLESGSEPATAEVLALTARPRAWDGRFLLGLVTPVLLLACAELLFRPFTTNYKGAYAAFELWQGSRTPLNIYLLMYGPSLFPIAVGAVVEVAGLVWHHRHKLDVTNLLWVLVALLTALVLLVVLVGYLDVKIAWLAVALGGAATVLLVAPTTPVRHRLLWFWVGTASALSMLVEAAVLKGDIGRMNTVFKFHLQVWMLFAVGAAVVVERLVHSPNGLRDLFAAGGPASPLPPALDDVDRDVSAAPMMRRTKRITALSDTVAVVVVLLVLGGGLYPAFAIPAKIRDRWVPSAPHTLDGMAYVQSAVQYERGAEIRTEADYRVIRWLQENVEGSPTIIEAQAEREYLWGSRITIYTGLPSVAAWRWHQVQQRMIMPGGTVEARQQDIRVFYNSGSPDRAREILNRYQVEYVILAPYERAYMLPEGLPKFATMVELGWLEVVYQDQDSTIYWVVG